MPPSESELEVAAASCASDIHERTADACSLNRDGETSFAMWFSFASPKVAWSVTREPLLAVQ
jgi:hypothetical protein